MRSEDLRLSLRRVGLFALCGALAALPLVVVIWLRSQPRRPRQVTAQASVQADRGEPRQEVRPPPAYDPPAALAMQWLSCPSGLERVAAGNGHVQSLVAYPPLRAADGAAIGTLLGADLQVPARVLDEAQGYYRQGKFLQAIAAAHLLVGQDDALEQQAYHLLGASACALHRLQPFGEAYRQLDAAGRERLLADCQGAAAPH